MTVPALTRRRLLLTAAAGACLPAGPARAATLPAPVSLRDELARALAQRQPLVVLVSLAGCPYCELVRNNYLAPLRAQEGLPVVQIDWGSARAVRDLGGQATTHDALCRLWRIGVAPTLLFFGRDGAEAAERLRGASIPDFYGAYLDERLRQARAALGGERQAV